MVSTTLSIGIILDLVTAAWLVFVAVAIQVRLQGPSPIEQALRWSMLFWYGAAGFMILDGGYAMLVLQTDVPRILQLAVLMTRRLLFAVGTFAIVHLLWTMRTGGREHLGWLAGYYLALSVLIEAVTLYQWPDGHIQEVWSIQFVPSRDTPLWLNVSIGAALFAPLGVAAIRALALYRHMPTRGQRFRLAAFCYCVLSFVIGVLIGFVDNGWYWYGLFENRLVFTVGIGMWLVMHPFWIARRRGVTKLEDLSRFPGRHMFR